MNAPTVGASSNDALVPGFVVIGRNEGPRLEQCLHSVLRVSNRVIYADSASTDRSVAMAQALGVKVVSLADDGKLSAARGRNAGYAELRRRFPECTAIQFLDGDCILQPDWIARAKEFLEHHADVAVVCGRRFEAHPQQSIYNALCDREWNTSVGEAEECGGDALVRRVAFDQVQGYRDSLRAGEEPEMSARMRALGWRIWRIDQPMTEHDAKILSFRQWWRRTRRGGFGYAQVWEVTAGLPCRLYARSLRSAFSWAIVLPFTLLTATAVTRQPFLLLVLPAAYLLQIARISRNIDAAGKSKWIDATLIQIAKVAEAMGALQYFAGGRPARAFDYKLPG